MGGYEAVRKWYSVVDPRTNQLVPGFDVCSACVGVVEAILPQLAGGVFVPKEDFGYPRGERRMCDLRFDTERFVQYFDALESMAEQTPRYLGRYIPHTDPFVDVVRSLASSAIAKCEKDREVRNGRWYVISQLPELTVCKSCFTQVIKLEAERGGRAIPRMFEVELRPIGSCQLYSDRMRDIFREAVKNDDFVLLARKARERKEKELEYREDLEAAKGYRGERREEEETIAERRWRRWE